MNLLTRVLMVAIVSLPVSTNGWSADAPAGSYAIRNVEGDHLDVVTPTGQPLLRYMYAFDAGDPSRRFDTAKVFAHVIGPDGLSTLTKGPGGLFPHHRGIFIGWNRIQHGGKTHDLWHVRNTSQVHDRFIRTTADTQGGIVSSMVRWIGVDGEPILIEARTHRVLRDEDAYALIDFTSQLTASNGPVKLDGDPEHAGVQFRPSQQVAENKSATYTFHADGIDPRKDLDLPWVAVTFRLGDQAWTVQQMSHPDNPPGARWSAYRDYGRFGPFPVIEIPNGESRTLRYRFRITPGPAPPRTELAAAYEKYASP